MSNYGRSYAVRKPTIMESIHLGSKTAPQIKAAIDVLGRMNDRHLLALANRDKQALKKLADEYETLGRHGGCPTLANIIRTEAKAIRTRTIKRGDVITTPEMAVTP